MYILECLVQENAFKKEMVYIKNFVDNIWSSHPRRNITHYNLLVRLSLEGQTFDFCESNEEKKGEQMQRVSGKLQKSFPFDMI